MMRPYRFVLIMASIAILVNLYGVLQYGIASYAIIGLAIGIIILVGTLMFRIRRRFLKDFIIIFFTGGITLSLASLPLPMVNQSSLSPRTLPLEI